MIRITSKAIAVRMGAFLLAAVVSVVLNFAHSIYVNRQSVFISAAYDGEITRMKVMYALGVDINAPACRLHSCFTPLIAAGCGGHPQAIQFVLDRGAPVNKMGRFGKTPLMMAAYYGEDAGVELLLLRGADVNAKDRDGNTALSLAKLEGHWEVSELLRKAGAKETP